MSCALCVDEREVGKLEERYRIIKMLEDNFYFAEYEGIFWKQLPDRRPTQVDVSEIIELIKGETKPFLTAPQVEQIVHEMLEE